MFGIERPAFIPDAPYIIDAERHGPPHSVPVRCPNCGEVCNTIYAIGSQAFGCEYCVDVMDADEWEKEGRE